jgi:hypothetical protein
VIINLDKFFVEELEKAGYFGLDYSHLVSLYRASRQNPKYLLRRKRKMEEEERLMWIAEKYDL